MHAGNALPPPAWAGDGGDQERGGIGGKDAVVADNGFKLPEDFLLERQVLEHRLDDDAAIGEAVEGLGY